MDTSPSVPNITYSLGLDGSHAAHRLNLPPNDIQPILTCISTGSESVASASFNIPHHPTGMGFDPEITTPFETLVYGGDIFPDSPETNPSTMYSNITASKDYGCSTEEIEEVLNWALNYHLTHNIPLCLQKLYSKNGELFFEGKKVEAGMELHAYPGFVIAIDDGQNGSLTNYLSKNGERSPDWEKTSIKSETDFKAVMGLMEQEDGAFLINMGAKEHPIELFSKIYDSKIDHDALLPEELNSIKKGTRTKLGIFLSSLGAYVFAAKQTLPRADSITGDDYFLHKGLDVKISTTYAPKKENKNNPKYLLRPGEYAIPPDDILVEVTAYGRDTRGHPKAIHKNERRLSENYTGIGFSLQDTFFDNHERKIQKEKNVGVGTMLVAQMRGCPTYVLN